MKKVEKTFMDKNGVEHHEDCPASKAAWKSDGGGPCPGEAIMKAINSIMPASSSGPAQVATEEYRNNWDAIFGAKKTVGQA